MNIVSLILDILIILILIICVTKNAIRGFIRSFIVFSRTVLSIFVAYILNAPVARFLSEKIFDGCARGWIYDYFIKTEVGDYQYALYSVFDGIPDWFIDVTVSSGIDEWMVQEYFIDKNPAPYDAMVKISHGLGDALSGLISAIIAFIILFVLMQIIVSILGIFLNKLGKLPMLNVVNRILGGIIGAVIAAVLAWIIAVLARWIVEFGANYYPNVFTQEIIDKTVIVKFLLEHDLWLWAKETLAIQVPI